MAEHPGVETLLLGATVEAQRALLRAREPGDVVEALEGAIHQLGGSVVPGHLDGPETLPLDVSVGVGAPRLPWAPPDGPARGQLQRVLPGLVEDARTTVHRLWRLSDTVEHPTSTDAVTGALDPGATVRLAGRLGSGDALVGVALRDADALEDTHGPTRVGVLLHDLGRLLRSELEVGDQLGRLAGPAVVGILLRTAVDTAEGVLRRVADRWDRHEPDTRTLTATVPVDTDGEEALADLAERLGSGAWTIDPVRHA